MTVARKLALLPLVSLVAILALSAGLLYSIDAVFRAANFANENTVPSLVVLQRLDSNFVGERLNVWQHVATTDAAGMAAAEKQMAARRQSIDVALHDYEALVADDKDRQMLAADRQAVADYDTVRDKVLSLSSAGRKAEAAALLLQIKAQVAKATETVDQHLAYNVELGNAGSATAARTRTIAVSAAIGLGLLTAVFIGALGFVLFRQIMRQLGGEPADVADVANRVAKGDFSSHIRLREGDTTSLFSSVARMQQDLKQRLDADNARIADERAHAAAELAAGIENARIRTALDRVSAGVTLVDDSGSIIYANDFVVNMFREHAAQVRTLVPQFDPGRIVGMRFDELCPGSASLAQAHTEEIKLGDATLRLIATPVLDDRQGRVGTVVQWIDRTQEVLAEQEVAAIVGKATEGDLTARIAESGKQGFYKILAEGMNSLIVSVAAVIRAMSKAAIEVRTGSDEISRGNMDLSQRTEQQASSLEETAASMEQMTSMVKSNADNAAQANQLAAAARQQAERGGKVVSSAVHAMNEINVASKRIADIIGVIDDIAFQTNLLALNAAVEAARAGEQGRGFAVVASEVRSLASRSAQAAKEIKGLIQDSVGKVADGARLVDESGKVLGEIVTGVQKVTDVMAEIAASSMEQASGIEQVNKAVTAMDSVTQQNAALVEQASAAAQTLTEQSANLMELIARYRIDELRTAAGINEPATFQQPAMSPPAAAQAKPKSVPIATEPPRKERRGANRPFTRKAAKQAGANPPAPPPAAVGDDDTWQEF